MGATTVTSPSGASTAASALIPSAWTPSSLVTSMRGIGTTDRIIWERLASDIDGSFVKSQIPNPKKIPMTTSEIPTRNGGLGILLGFGTWDLGSRWALGFGIWALKRPTP